MNYPPGPKERFPGSLLLKFRRDPIKTMMDIREECGDISHFRVGRRHVYLVSNPDFVGDVLTTLHRDFVKGQKYHSGLRFLGEGLLASEGDFHDSQRRVIQPAFHHQRVASYGEVMTRFASEVSEGWSDGGELDIHGEMMKTTLRIVAKTLLGYDLGAEASDLCEAFSVGMEYFSRVTNPAVGLLDKLPLPANRRFRMAEERLDSIVFRIIREGRANQGERDHLLSLLLGSRNAEGGRLSDLQIRDEVATFLLAGVESTSNMLTWAWYMLSQNPSEEGNLHAELDEVLAGRLPTAEDVPELKRAAMVLTESMRLYPPAWLLARKAVNDCTIRGYPVHAGSVVLLSLYTMFRDSRYFPEPDRFVPGRWANGGERSLPKFAFIPFGAGIRSCIGEPFARMEGILLLATIAQKWKMRMLSDHPAAPSPGFTLRPDNGMRMRTNLRNP